jgi:hypothetical protein
MIWPIYVTLLVVGFVATGLTLIAALRGDVAGVAISNRVGIGLSAFAFVIWGVVAINSFEIVTITDSGQTTTELAEMAVLAMVGGGVMLASMLKAAVAEIDSQGGLI